MKTGKILSISIAVILVLTAVIIIDTKMDTIPGVDGAVLYVPSSFTTIQSAINSASSGDTIVIANGTYYNPFLINRSNDRNIKTFGKAPLLLALSIRTSAPP